MKANHILALIVSTYCCCSISHAQPGPQFFMGLTINQMVDESGKDLEAKTIFKFLYNQDEVFEHAYSKYIFRIFELRDSSQDAVPSQEILPYSNVNLGHQFLWPIDHTGPKSAKAPVHLRYMIYTAEDSMVIDFFNIHPIPSGKAYPAFYGLHCINMERLEYLPGHYRYFLHPNAASNFEKNTAYYVTVESITGKRMAYLKKQDWFEQVPYCQNCATNKLTQTPDYIHHRAILALSEVEAITTYEKVREDLIHTLQTQRLSTKDSIAFLATLAKSYRLEADYESELNYLQQIMLNPSLYHQLDTSEQLRLVVLRRECYRHLKQANKALQDNEDLIEQQRSIGSSLVENQLVKAEILAFDLGRFDSAVKVIQLIAQHSPEKAHTSAINFPKGHYLFLSGDTSSAYSTWLKGAIYNHARYNQGSMDRRFLNQMIQADSQSGLLHMIAGLQYLSGCNSSVLLADYGPKADYHFRQAKLLGYESYLLPMYRSRLAYWNREYKEAFQLIEKAAAMNDKNPLIPFYRYHLRVVMKRAKPGDNSDPDIIKYYALREKWWYTD